MPASRRLLEVSLAGALVCVPLSSGTAHAAFPGSDGRVALVKNNSIYTITSSGADLKLVARGGTMPRWSPDGRRIAMVRRGNVWVMNADGTHQAQATRSGGLSAPTWSPDGAWLGAVAVPVGGGTNTIVKFGSTAPFGAAVVVTDSYVENRRIAWSPDGASIAFNGGAFDGTAPCVDDGLTCISKVDVATGAVNVMTWTGGSVHSIDDMFAPDWKPDSSGILFSLVQTARDYSENGTPLHVNVLQPSTRYTTDGGVYSPSGGKVAFTKRTGNRHEIFTAKADGTGWKRIAAGRDPDWQPAR